MSGALRMHKYHTQSNGKSLTKQNHTPLQAKYAGFVLRKNTLLFVDQAWPHLTIETNFRLIVDIGRNTCFVIKNNSVTAKLAPEEYTCLYETVL